MCVYMCTGDPRPPDTIAIATMRSSAVDLLLCVYVKEKEKEKENGRGKEKKRRKKRTLFVNLPDCFPWNFYRNTERDREKGSVARRRLNKLITRRVSCKQIRSWCPHFVARGFFWTFKYLRNPCSSCTVQGQNIPHLELMSAYPDTRPIRSELQATPPPKFLKHSMSGYADTQWKYTTPPPQFPRSTPRANASKT